MNLFANVYLGRYEFKNLANQYLYRNKDGFNQFKNNKNILVF